MGSADPTEKRPVRLAGILVVFLIFIYIFKGKLPVETGGRGAAEREPLSEPAYYIGSALALYRQGKEEEALQRLASGLQLDPEHAAGNKVLGEIYYARNEPEKAVAAYPEKTIVAVLYADRQFRDVTQSPAWTKGLFDGKIHLPVGGSTQNDPLFEKLIYHEYTHALIYQLHRERRRPG